jgi:hypothetical protein
MSNSDGGFWRLRHDHLAALLARRDLSWAVARVYLALADLTWGYGKERDEVSISQIAEHAGMFSTGPDGRQCLDTPHTNRALKELAGLGLCGSASGEGQAVLRWVVWPPPEYRPAAGTAEHGTTAKAGSSATAEVGRGTTANATAKTTANATALGGSGTTARQGRHQEVIRSPRDQDTQERERERTAADAATDSLSLVAAQSDDNDNGDNNGNGAAGEKRNNGNDVDRVIAFAFPGGCSEKQRAAVVNAIANAVRQGASYPLLAHAVRSPKAQEETPWERIEEAGKRTAALLDKARYVWPPFKGETFLDLLKHMPENWRPKPVAKREGETEMAFSERERRTTGELLPLAEAIDAWRQQATTWPKDGPAAGVQSQERPDSP